MSKLENDGTIRPEIIDVVDSIVNNEIKGSIGTIVKRVVEMTGKDVEKSTDYIRKCDAKKYVLENDKNIYYDLIHESRKARKNLLDTFRHDELCEYITSPYNVSYNTLFDALYNNIYNVSPNGECGMMFDDSVLERIKRFYDLFVEKNKIAKETLKENGTFTGTYQH